LFLIGTYSLAREEIKKLSKKVIITSQLMGKLLQTPAHRFVQTRVHNMSSLLVRMTLQMMKRMDDYFYVIKMLKAIMMMIMMIVIMMIVISIIMT
jgi:hypothetical protein